MGSEKNSLKNISKLKFSTFLARLYFSNFDRDRLESKNQEGWKVLLTLLPHVWGLQVLMFPIYLFTKTVVLKLQVFIPNSLISSQDFQEKWPISRTL